MDARVELLQHRVGGGGGDIVVWGLVYMQMFAH